MPNPKKKHTPMRRDMRRSANFKLSAASMAKCGQCGAFVLPHHVCPACGFYSGQLVAPPKQRKKKGKE